MTKINFRSCLPYAIALIIFILIAYIYASPVLEGKIINQADISSYQGAAKERDDFDFCQFLFAVACDGNQCPALYCRSFGLRFMCL